MAACLAFVFLGLVEFAYVNVLTRVEKKRPKDEPIPSRMEKNKQELVRVRAFVFCHLFLREQFAYQRICNQN